MPLKYQDFLDKEMSRKEFLATVGLGLASLLGFASVLQMLKNGSNRSTSFGYGSSVYGGKKSFRS